jgi:hypothetical protein
LGSFILRINNHLADRIPVFGSRSLAIRIGLPRELLEIIAAVEDVLTVNMALVGRLVTCRAAVMHFRYQSTQASQYPGSSESDWPA